MAGAIWRGLIFTGGLGTYALEGWLGLPGQWFSLAAALLVIVMLNQRQGMATALFYRERKPARSLSFTPRTSPPDSRGLTETIDQTTMAS